MRIQVRDVRVGSRERAKAKKLDEERLNNQIRSVATDNQRKNEKEESVSSRYEN
jgi:hypothetical protein